MMRRLAAAFIALAALEGMRTYADQGLGEGHQRPVKTTADVLQCAFGNHPEPSADVLWFVQGRVIPHSDPEWQYTLRQMSGGVVVVEFLSVQGTRLLGRPETANAKTCEDLLSFAKVARRVVRAGECAAIRQMVAHFQELKLPSVPDASIRLDSSEYLVTAGTPEGDEYRWRIAGRSDQGNSAHPIATWSEDLRRAVKTCP